MRTLTTSLTLLAFLASATPAFAQLSEKDAIKQLKASSKSQLKAFKANAAAALGSLDANLKVIEGAFSESSDAFTVGSQVGSMSHTYIGTLNEAYGVAKSLVESSASVALEAMADGGDLQGLYPEDFYYGSGGVLDKHRAALVKAAIKSRDAAMKRLAKAAAKAEKDANIALTFELRFPTRVLPLAVDQGALTTLNQAATIDVILAASDLDVAQDGMIFFAGQTDDKRSDVAVDCFGGLGGIATDEVTPDSSTGRFFALFVELDEGGWVVNAKQATGGVFHSVGEIGIR